MRNLMDLKTDYLKKNDGHADAGGDGHDDAF